MEKQLALPAYEQVLKAAHTFNLLDARGALDAMAATVHELGDAAGIGGGAGMYRQGFETVLLVAHCTLHGGLEADPRGATQGLQRQTSEAMNSTALPWLAARQVSVR